MMNATLEKFGYPESLIASWSHWHLLLRPGQVTLGSLVLYCREDVTSYGELSVAAIKQQGVIVAQLEAELRELLGNDKLNYLMLMMVDPEVHFHVLPRYQASVEFEGQSFADDAWPGPCNLGTCLELDPLLRASLLKQLQDRLRVDGAGTPKKHGRMYTSGCFDIFHHGHLNILTKTKAMCDYLVVGVSTDELVLSSKGRAPVIPFEERISILNAIEMVDEVIPQVDKNKQRVVDEYRIDAISVGSDWKGRYPSVTCEMEYLDYTPTISSTILKQKLNLM
jgi:glycerol-3-phosphate cytidylyltransferase